MGRIRPLAALIAGLLALMAMAAPARAATVLTETSTLTGDTNGSNIGGSSIGGSFGVEFFSNGVDIIFSNIQVNVNDQGQAFTYDFSYHCVAGTLGCTSNPTVFSQYPNASGFPVKYTIDTGQVPACPFPTLGHTTSCSATVDTSVTDFVFVTTGKGLLTETFSFKDVAPEPTTWAMMLLGFGGLGAALRRRRVARAPLAA